MVFLLSKTVLGDSHTFCIMIVLKKFRGSSAALLLRFQSDFDSIWVFSDGYGWFQTSYRWFQLDSDQLWLVGGSGKFWGIADGFEWMALLAFWWFWVVCYLNSYGYCIFPVSWHFFSKTIHKEQWTKVSTKLFLRL